MTPPPIGYLPAIAYNAMELLQQAGIKVIPITGRPAGWCDHFVRMWPVDGLIGKNGAFCFDYDCVQHRMIRQKIIESRTNTLKSDRLRNIRWSTVP